MRPFFKKPLVLAVVIILLGAGGFAVFKLSNKPPEAPKVDNSKYLAIYKVIGTSVEGRKIESYTYGKGEKKLLFVGGIHGGYEWNSVLLAYKFINYLDNNPGIIPDNLTVSVIPSANPDGVYAVTHKTGNFAVSDVSTYSNVLASGRFNANEVDLNRNFYGFCNEF